MKIHSYLIQAFLIGLLLTACGNCKNKNQPTEKQQEETAAKVESPKTEIQELKTKIQELKTKIQELKTERKKRINILVEAFNDKWKEGNLNAFRRAFKVGKFKGLYEIYLTKIKKQGKPTDEESLQKLLSKLKNNAKKEKKDYSLNILQIAMLEKNLYKFYKVYLLERELSKTTKQEVEGSFNDLKEKEKNGSLKEKDARILSVIIKWKALKPIFKAEQEKREELKKLQAEAAKQAA